MIDVGEIAARPLFSLLDSFSAAFYPTCYELAIHCVANLLDESTDIQRLGLNLDRRRAIALGGSL